MDRDASIMDCVSCGESECIDVGRHHTPNYMKDHLEYNAHLGKNFFVVEEVNFTVPLEYFYETEKHNGHSRPPIDCRSCEKYQTSRCIPLQNAMDEVIFTSENLPSTQFYENMYGAVANQRIKPCGNFQMNSNIGFKDYKNLYEWLDMLEAYCGLALPLKVEQMDELVWTVNYFALPDQDPEIPAPFQYSK